MCDLDRNGQHLFALAAKDSPHGLHIAVVTSDGHAYVLPVHELVVRGVEPHPAEFLVPGLDPGVACRGATQRWVGRIDGRVIDVPARVAGRDARAPQYADRRVAEILTDPPTPFEEQAGLESTSVMPAS